MSTTDLLTISGLEVSFGDVRAVRGLDLTVAPGEILALVGESGSGKSVTARAVLGLLPPTARVRGSVLLGTRELVGAGEEALREVRGRSVAMVFQEPATALNPVHTVGWQIAAVLRAHRGLTRQTARRDAVRLLDLVGIPDPATRVRHYPHQLSGGQKQRVVIALALANEPDLIIADEPTTALDVTVQAEILALLRDLRDRLGTAILLITHNMGVVADLADRVAVLHRGELVEQAPVDELFAAPTRAYTRELLAAVPRLGHRDPALPHTGADALRLTGVTVRYGDFTALSTVDLHVARGEVVGLVGESGSGKSTLGRVAAGVLRPDAGTALVLDTDPRSARRRFGFVFQDPGSSLNPRMTIAECVAEPLRVHRAPGDHRARVAELLDAVRLPADFATRRPRELSGGQRQRVGIARALALDPDLLIADEPTSALDVSVQASILALLTELQQQRGFACLFISHDLAVVDSLAHRVAVLHNGRVVEHGPHHEVLRTPTAAYTRRLVDAVPLPDPVAQRARRTGLADVPA
ncbi:ABC transporter ATP-binding protein [Actinosynnema sp. NPDC047251]|uniref:Glutathione import ATP-binding protein GsiA n=1 Tax=Saccharothrix espanaensis (strain ATCC 51144 / DSM 44229 / JCM 9112 / NBRC 15066 / NRRL 15764) TaxID=1179773 RepID=K0K934_SACES|nr:ABC transporter ATP-binding protein [Saccharothrix espanaensis]CCH33103.1 Glutathione import ATP-binding protein GsiA [Saccharothrix espanaensis DSM 44229]